MDSYFIHKQNSENISQAGFRVKATNYNGSYGPFFNFMFRKMLEKLHGFDSFFIHRYTFIKYRSSSILGEKSTNNYGSYCPFLLLFFFFNKMLDSRLYRSKSCISWKLARNPFVWQDTELYSFNSPIFDAPSPSPLPPPLSRLQVPVP